MSGILVVPEQRAGVLHKMSLEALAAGQKLGNELGQPVYAAMLVPGAPSVSEYHLEAVHLLDHPLLADYTSDAYVIALRQLIEAHKPSFVLFPHTYQVRDFAPRLATSFNRVLVSDVVGHRVDNGAVVFVRQMFQGKMAADVPVTGDGPVFASVQAGAYRADSLLAGAAGTRVFAVALEAAQIRTRPLDRFRESGGQWI